MSPKGHLRYNPPTVQGSEFQSLSDWQIKRALGILFGKGKSLTRSELLEYRVFDRFTIDRMSDKDIAKLPPSN